MRFLVRFFFILKAPTKRNPQCYRIGPAIREKFYDNNDGRMKTFLPDEFAGMLKRASFFRRCHEHGHDAPPHGGAPTCELEGVANIHEDGCPNVDTVIRTQQDRTSVRECCFGFARKIWCVPTRPGSHVRNKGHEQRIRAGGKNRI